MSDAWTVYVAIASVVVLGGGVLAGAWVRGRLGLVASGMFVVAVLVWVLAFAAVASGFNDADGFVDCREACTGTHYSAAVGVLAPPLLISLSAAGMVVALVRRSRARRYR